MRFRKRWERPPVGTQVWFIRRYGPYSPHYLTGTVVKRGWVWAHIAHGSIGAARVRWSDICEVAA